VERDKISSLKNDLVLTACKEVRISIAGNIECDREINRLQ
jgi:hypothetical protein